MVLEIWNRIVYVPLLCLHLSGLEVSNRGVSNPKAVIIKDFSVVLLFGYILS